MRKVDSRGCASNDYSSSVAGNGSTGNGPGTMLMARVVSTPDIIKICRLLTHQLGYYRRKTAEVVETTYCWGPCLAAFLVQDDGRTGAR